MAFDMIVFLMRNFSLIMNISLLIMYGFLVFWMGGYVMRGYAGFVRRAVKWVGRLAFGFLSLICGLGISSFIPSFTNDFFLGLLQRLFINAIIGVVISTVVLYFALKMVAHNVFNIPGIDRAIKRLQDRKKKALDVESKESLHKKQGIRHPVRLGGVILLAGFLIVSLAGFRGFPDPMEEMGFSQDDLESMADTMEGADELLGEMPSDPETLSECMRAAEVLSDQATIAAAKPYTDSLIEGLVEERTGEDVTGLYTITSGPDTYILALTETQTCLTTMDAICMCQETA